MNKTSDLKPMGLYSLEEKNCGCKVKRYSGGKVVTIGCMKHETVLEYVCPICEKKHNKKDL